MGNYGSANLREVPELKKRVAIVRYSMYIRLFKKAKQFVVHGGFKDK